MRRRTNSARRRLISRELTRRCGKIFQDLKAKGKPIPVNDIWIAAKPLGDRRAFVYRAKRTKHSSVTHLGEKKLKIFFQTGKRSPDRFYEKVDFTQ